MVGSSRSSPAELKESSKFRELRALEDALLVLACKEDATLDVSTVTEDAVNEEPVLERLMEGFSLSSPLVLPPPPPHAVNRSVASMMENSARPDFSTSLNMFSLPGLKLCQPKFPFCGSKWQALLIFSMAWQDCYR